MRNQPQKHKVYLLDRWTVSQRDRGFCRYEGLNRRLDTASFLGLNLLNTADLFLQQHLYESKRHLESHTRLSLCGLFGIEYCPISGIGCLPSLGRNLDFGSIF
jgi:hypothetical protein